MATWALFLALTCRAGKFLVAVTIAASALAAAGGTFVTEKVLLGAIAAMAIAAAAAGGAILVSECTVIVGAAAETAAEGAAVYLVSVTGGAPPMSFRNPGAVALRCSGNIIGVTGGGWNHSVDSTAVFAFAVGTGAALVSVTAAGGADRLSTAVRADAVVTEGTVVQTLIAVIADITVTIAFGAFVFAPAGGAFTGMVFTVEAFDFFLALALVANIFALAQTARIAFSLAQVAFSVTVTAVTSDF